MQNLFLLLGNITDNISINFIDILHIISLLCAIYVIVNKNPIISILFLIGLFLSISVYLISLGISFLGLSYLIVYVGAVSILFLFILMLMNIRISELSTDNTNSLPLGILVFILFYIFISIMIPLDKQQVYIVDFFNQVFNLFNKNHVYDINDNLLYPISNSWEGNLLENSHISALGNIIYTNYFIWLILSSIILLLAMIGSIVITIKSN